MEVVRVNRSCAFCGRREAQLTHLLEGRDASICGSCVEEASALLAEASPKPEGKELTLRAARNRRRFAFQAIQEHFDGFTPEQIVTSYRVFPIRMRPDLHRAMEEDLSAEQEGFYGLHAAHSGYETQPFAALLRQTSDAAALVPARYEEVDVGEREPVRCLKNGLWLLHRGELPYAVYMTTAHEYGQTVGIQVEVAVPTGSEGADLAPALFGRLEGAIAEARCYRGKVLSLEIDVHFTGRASGVAVHRLEPVRAEDIILPESTLAALDRNVIRFARSRDALSGLGMPLKKGLLFHGPPGTGKSYTVRYLAGALPDHTTLLVTAEQVGIIHEYFALARLLQPSILVVEDADLIARERSQMGGPCEESLLNRLLNEMDGLREDVRVFFVLTTNRPESLEPAIASRPGRIDQAIEFPLPDASSRERLAALYARGLALEPAVLERIVARTEGVSASFIKELMRRAAQEYLEQKDDGPLSAACVDRALEEMLLGGGRLNVRLLGGAAGASD